ncbi:hypothetical protein [Hymenobacter arizonensis]|uniref:Uncharacterized protein n=1 Tax=Hymenobacter arizonensis TaxID=1227077 RepID=A0A1I5T990_HYMAR|nr:hypothetical protein [Hymenobacter arizonensis]SFP79593.1 hypothetical protein SAMN04515668_0372 [Hymenobacter arizonensis]
MDNVPITLTLVSGQVLAVTLSNPSEARVLADVAAAIGAARATAEVGIRTYHLGTRPTPGRGYDDRLTMRMGCGRTKIRGLLALSPRRGGLRHQRVGRKYIVSEAAVREWFGDNL